MQNENTTEKKKFYTAPAMEVVELDHQVHLLGESKIDGVDGCLNPPCRFD